MTSLKPVQHLFFTGILALLLLTHGCALLSQQQPSESVGEGAIQIKVPAELQVLSVGGQKLNSPSLAAGYYWLNVPEGKNQLIVQYEANWNSPDESGFYLRWDPVSINADFTTEQTYELDFTRYARRDEVIEAEKNPSVWLTVRPAVVLAKEPGATQQAALPAEKVKGVRVVEKEVITQYVPIETDADKDADAFYLNQLKILWKLTPKEQRSAFQLWLKSNTGPLYQPSEVLKDDSKAPEKVVF